MIHKVRDCSQAAAITQTPCSSFKHKTQHQAQPSPAHFECSDFKKLTAQQAIVNPASLHPAWLCLSASRTALSSQQRLEFGAAQSDHFGESGPQVALNQGFVFVDPPTGKA